MSGVPPIEPTADQRVAALTFRQMFLAFIMAGFTEEQALVLLAQQINQAWATWITNGQPDE